MSAAMHGHAMSEQEAQLVDLEEEERERELEEQEKTDIMNSVDHEGELRGEFDWEFTDDMSKYSFPLLEKYLRNTRSVLAF